ncbi:dihydrofolate reductase family protein [Leucobacter allii]|uniref:Dihydrofolate reductase family protein n=1 Tax=Leucobacter allii TaxID=2932247 RepID=A0ABY4FMW7_9MICO|nr:dihydrofolate reductase family protein [Leucobacter allii]UOQ57618.1 dihydrofolate reductase family protein [Leucobacter allii]
MGASARTGRIVIDLFTTLDGVAQAPGGPEEDPRGGFRFGGWQAPIDDDMVGGAVLDYVGRMDALLLGRRTYEIFAGYWPLHADNPVGRTFNAVPKYLASRDPAVPAPWAGTTRVGDDLAAELDALRERHREIHVVGSIDLVQTLVAERLFDELCLWVYPIVLGEGRTVFPAGAAPTNLRLIEPPRSGDAGAVQLRYAPLPGAPGTGVMPEPQDPA